MCEEQLRNSPHSLLKPKYWPGPLWMGEIALGPESEDLSTGSATSWVILDQSLPFLDPESEDLSTDSATSWVTLDQSLPFLGPESEDLSTGSATSWVTLDQSLALSGLHRVVENEQVVGW